MPSKHRFKQFFLVGIPNVTGTDFGEVRKGTRAVHGWYLESFSGDLKREREREVDWIKSSRVCVCVCVCVCACVRACVRACARARTCVCAFIYIYEKHTAFVFNCVYTKGAESLILCY